MSDISRPSWDDVWMQMSEVIATRSLCSRAQVGCVIVAYDQTVLSASYNGPPPGLELSGPCTGWCPRGRGEGNLDSSYSNCPSNHAEASGVVRCDYTRIKGATAYVTHSVCSSCAKLLASAKISRVVHKVSTADAHRNPEEVEEFLRSCGVEVIRWPIAAKLPVSEENSK